MAICPTAVGREPWDGRCARLHGRMRARAPGARRPSGPLTPPPVCARAIPRRDATAPAPAFFLDRAPPRPSSRRGRPPGRPRPHRARRGVRPCSRPRLLVPPPCHCARPRGSSVARPSPAAGAWGRLLPPLRSRAPDCTTTSRCASPLPPLPQPPPAPVPLQQPSARRGSCLLVESVISLVRVCAPSPVDKQSYQGTHVLSAEPACASFLGALCHSARLAQSSRPPSPDPCSPHAPGSCVARACT